MNEIEDSPFTIPNQSTTHIQPQQQIPKSILNNQLLKQLISSLPPHYDFELPKTIHRIIDLQVTRLALQFPEGLLIFACKISDIIKRLCKRVNEIIILGDITYGGCCIDDYTGKKLNVELIVHYGHSCLIPIKYCQVSIMYIFVKIKLEVDHLLKIIRSSFEKNEKIILCSIIQFVNSLKGIENELNEYIIEIPQIKPLSKGEILGCTSPKLNEEKKLIIFIGDGRFHIESIMIQNPHCKAYKYDPYTKKMTLEKFDHDKLMNNRKKWIEKAQKNINKVGVVLTTLGRQGNTKIMNNCVDLLKKRKIPYVILLVSEIFPSKLNLIPDVDFWVQIACPRLSIDWGDSFEKPLLNPYEFFVAMGDCKWNEVYPMNNYTDKGEKWNNSYDYGLKKKILTKEEKLIKKQQFRERMNLVKEKENKK